MTHSINIIVTFDDPKTTLLTRATEEIMRSLRNGETLLEAWQEGKDIVIYVPPCYPDGTFMNKGDLE